MKKLVNVIAVVVAVGAGGYAVYAAQVNRQQQNQLSEYTARLDQMLTQVEDNTRRRLDYERQLEDLQRQLLQASNRVQNLGSELAQAQEQIDPDYAQVEQRIRRQVSAEYAQRTRSEASDLSPAALINQLTSVSPEERMAIMAVQGQYGDFLNSLNVNSQRREVIAEALVNMTVELNQKRMDLATRQLEPREMRQQMVALNSPQSVRDSLAYTLTDDELARLETFQQNQPNVMVGTAGAGGNVFMFRGDRPGGRGRRGDSADGEPGAGTFRFDVLPGGGPDGGPAIIQQLRVQPQPN